MRMQKAAKGKIKRPSISDFVPGSSRGTPFCIEGSDLYPLIGRLCEHAGFCACRRKPGAEIRRRLIVIGRAL
ncbi:hypothetical protein DXA13_20090 [Clostridium sp. AM58-1XD]|nr:hypothetical protein DXA13_20090 [Clostridium sp. AM58-1XD]